MRCAGSLGACARTPAVAGRTRACVARPPVRARCRTPLLARGGRRLRGCDVRVSADGVGGAVPLQAEDSQPPGEVGDASGAADDAWSAAEAVDEATALARLVSGAAPVTLETLQACFPLRFDKFQKRSLQAVLADKSVVVSAPTGSGKTLIAEAAVVAALAAGKRAFYTTPLKALSNQKLREFRERFGVGMVGLKTGDAAINPDARVVVMTTEILRNMLYRSAGGTGENDSLANVGLVVLDEVHYLSDADRGTVWEECVIYSPKNVQLLCLSATVGNPDDLQNWITAAHGPCELVTSNWRPVPLSFYFAKRNGGGDDRGGGGGPAPGLAPLLSRRGDRINRALEAQADDEDGGRGPRMLSSWRRDAPSQETVVRHLLREQLLPAIWFIFSRARCDEAVAAMTSASASLVTPEEKARLQAALDGLRSSCPEALRPEYAEPLLAGVAAHHAGCLPAWKSLVEELFQQGVLKIVFATETLAAGINMPARAVVLSSTSKRDAEGPRSLTVNEFMQMAGRAGRRGYDTQGAVVLVQSPFEGADAGAQLALGEPEALVSRFAVSYGMVLNLLRGRSLAQVQTVVNASFGNFLRNLARSARGARHASLVAELELLRQNMSPKVLEAERALATMTKLRGRLQEERRALRILQQQLAQEPRVELAVASGDGDSHWLVGKPLPVPVLIRVAPGGAARSPREQAPDWGELRPDAAFLRGAAAAVEEDEEDEVDADDRSDELFGDFAGALPRGARVEDEMEAAGEVVLSAAIVSFERVAAPDDASSSFEFTALGADNVWYRGPLDVVVSVADAWLLNPGQVPSPPPELSQASAWLWRSGTWRAPGGRSTFPAAGRISNALMGIGEGDGLPELADGDAARFVADAQERIAKLERQLAAMTSDTALQKSIRKAATRINRVRTLEASVARLGRRLQETAPAGWGDFQSAVAVLRSLGALIGEDAPELTRLGEAAASVRSQNELWMAMALLSGALDALEPGALAGVITALLSEECVSRPNVFAAYRPSASAAAALDQLLPIADRLEQLQLEHAFDAPVSLSPQFVGLVESWTAGADWSQVCADTSMDEGDVARLLRRVAEFLGQVGDVPHTSAALRTAARNARRLVDRPPISDLMNAV